MTKRLSVSVVIPAYNAEKYVRATLESMLSQTILPDEIVVVDDGSKDDTCQIVEQIAEAHPGLIKIVRQANAGVSAALNTGVKNASGEQIAIIAADDLWLPNYLEELLKQAGARRIVCSDYQLIDAQGQLIAERRLRFSQVKLPEMLLGNSLLAVVLMDRQLWEEVGPFDQTLTGNEDWEWFVRALLKGVEVKYIPLALWQYRQHGGSATSRVQMMAENAIRVVDKIFNQPDFPAALQPYRSQAYYLNYVIGAGKMYAAGDTVNACHYLQQARQAAPASFFSLQTFISFLKIYSQSAKVSLLDKGQAAVEFIIEGAETPPQQPLLTGLGYFSLGLLTPKARPRQAAFYLLTGLRRCPALFVKSGFYRPIFRYAQIYLTEIFNQVRVRGQK